MTLKIEAIGKHLNDLPFSLCIGVKEWCSDFIFVGRPRIGNGILEYYRK